MPGILQSQFTEGQGGGGGGEREICDARHSSVTVH